MKTLFIALICVFMASCSNVQPEFKFKLDLNGQVHDSKTRINSSFTGHVHNDTIPFSLMKTMKVDSSASNQSADEWLDEYMQANLSEMTQNSTLYRVHVKGYVQEVTSGITVSVDKIYKNTDSLFVK